MNAGNAIKNKRIKMKLTRNQLANKVGLSQESIYKYETNQRKPTDDNKIKIANALDSTVSELFFNNK